MIRQLENLHFFQRWKNCYMLSHLDFKCVTYKTFFILRFSLKMFLFNDIPCVLNKVTYTFGIWWILHSLIIKENELQILVSWYELNYVNNCFLKFIVDFIAFNFSINWLYFYLWWSYYTGCVDKISIWLFLLIFLKTPGEHSFDPTEPLSISSFYA